MRNQDITLEICSNTEWLRDQGGLDLDRVADNWENEAANELASQLHRRLEAAGYQTVCAAGARALYHGWNGACGFAYRRGAVASYDRLEVAQTTEIDRIYEAAVAAAQGTWPKYAAYEIGGVHVEMSEAQAEAWNEGDLADAAMTGAVVHLPGRAGATSRMVGGMVVMEDGLPTSTTITLAEALDRPELAAQMDGMPANRAE